VILPVLSALGWTQWMRQTNTSQQGRYDIPDFLLFASDAEKAAARAERQDERRYRHGKLIVEAKRWGRPLDRGDRNDPLDPGTPSSQMLRYLSRVEVASDRAIEWGILTNGRLWRVYWQRARSRSEEFLQFDLAELADVVGVNADLFAPVNAEKVHYLRAFYLLFRRYAFLPQPTDADGRSFHAVALEEGRLWETKVSQDLGDRVFDELFPKLAAAIAHNDRGATRPYSREYLDDVHRAALILLYRLLFVLYAEDRNLLPTKDRRYDDYSLRRLREDIGARRDHNDAFSATATRIWQHLRSLFRAIDRGDDSIGLPPYNGGLFHEDDASVLGRLELPDAELAPLIDGLSRRNELSGRAYINYRDLAVQHLGSIYERLLERRLVESTDAGVEVQPSTFARKNTGSYYTHDDLVKLILRETLDPLADERISAFDACVEEMKSRRGRALSAEQRVRRLTECDPANALLALKICDPAMGSGHFLVSLVDDLTDHVLEQLADASAKAATAGTEHYRSPIVHEIEQLRGRIVARAEQARWTIDQSLLDDRHLVRRMILKRVVHGVDKNLMAVELAKLALWLHTFTVGAPLSFLDHHLRCGDSLYGERIAGVRADLSRMGGLFSDSHIAGMLMAVQTMSQINAINDVDLSEVERSRSLMQEVEDTLRGLKNLLNLWQAARWLAPLTAPKAKRGPRHQALTDLLSGQFGRDLLMIASDRVHATVIEDHDKAEAINALLAECHALAAREGFLHWELAFPGVWPNPIDAADAGGFDAIIGNPPWDRIKLQEVEWFAERRRQIALQARASDRKKMIAQLRHDGDPLANDYDIAAQRAEDGARVARDCGEYPLLSSGDINLYSLFVERAMHLVKPGGMVGLLTPSGIAGDKGAAKFFRNIATTGRLSALFDFENKKVFFPDIHASFKFCALVFGGASRRFESARCAFYLHAVADLQPPALPEDADERTRKLATRVIALKADDFDVVNPNTGTAPIFRNALDAELTTRIYRQHPVLVRHVFGTRKKRGVVEKVQIDEDKLYPVRYCTMFHMTNDSDLFKRRDELEAEGWYPVAGGRWKKGDAEMLPLYVGRMIHHYDHRAASVTVNEENLHNPTLSGLTNDTDKVDPGFFPNPQYWVSSDADVLEDNNWCIGFRSIARTTDVRTIIASVVPSKCAGNSLPLLEPISKLPEQQKYGRNLHKS
jgi:Eco57I restriction-modification methylase